MVATSRPATTHPTGADSMTEPLIDRLARLAVDVARDTGWPLSRYVDPADTQLLELVRRFEADAKDEPAG